MIIKHGKYTFTFTPQENSEVIEIVAYKGKQKVSVDYRLNGLSLKNLVHYIGQTIANRHNYEVTYYDDVL